jgi:hypothetical protein
MRIMRPRAATARHRTTYASPIGAMNLTDQAVIRTLGSEPEGIFSAAHFAEGADIPATQKFVKDYAAKYGKIPSLFGFSMYSGAMWVSRAIEKVGGRVEDRDALIDAVLTCRIPRLGRRYGSMLTATRSTTFTSARWSGATTANTGMCPPRCI